MAIAIASPMRPWPTLSMGPPTPSASVVVQGVDALAQEVGRYGGVGVDAGYYVAAGVGDPQVEAAGGGAPRVVDETQVEVFPRGELLHEVAGAVAGGAVQHQHLEALAGVVLAGEAAEAGLDVAFLVAHRYEYRDKRQAIGAVWHLLLGLALRAVRVWFRCSRSLWQTP